MNTTNLFLRFRKKIQDLLPKISAERREEVSLQLQNNSRPGFDFFLLVLLSSVIATQGLLVDSAAVIIGAMLVAPLMSPIIGIGLSSITGERQMLRNAVAALVRGAGLAVLLAFLIAYSNQYLPFVVLVPDLLPGEVISRAQPGPIDMIVALAGGTAAAFALSMPNISAALPGVAIATALMPPLCTVGIGLALGRWDIAGGALLLFLTNGVAIAFASSLVFSGLGFRPRFRSASGNRSLGNLLFAGFLTLVLLVPLTIFSARFVGEATATRSQEEQNAKIDAILHSEVGRLAENGQANTRIEMVSWQMNEKDAELEILLTVRTTRQLLYRDGEQLQNNVGDRLQRELGITDKKISILLTQTLVVQLDPRIPPTATSTPTPTQTPTNTPTVTPGPSLTPTHTPTQTPTNTPTVLPTHTPTPTRTPTNTPTATPTPAQARATGYTLPGLRLRQSPGGPIIATLQPGAPLTVLYGSVVFEGLVWIEVEDTEGRIGWIPQIYLFQVTLTPTRTPTPTQTPSATPSPGG